MNPFSAILSAIRNIHRLGGRATRSEYWWVLAALILGIIFATYIYMTFFPNEAQQQGTVYAVSNLVFIAIYVLMLCLILSVTIRRLHDLNMSAWYACLYFLPLGLGFVFMGIICSRRGSPGRNRFGYSAAYLDAVDDLDVFNEIEEFG